MPLINCPKCNASFSDQAKKCPNCGLSTKKCLLLISQDKDKEKNIIICPECGSPVASGAKACGKCAFPMTQTKENLSKKTFIILLCIVFIALLAIAGSSLYILNYTRQDDSTTKQEDESSISEPVFEPTTENYVGNVFQIITYDIFNQPLSTGTGVVISPDGHFVTNAHVIDNAYFYMAAFDVKNTNGEDYTYLPILFGEYCSREDDIFIGQIQEYNKSQIADYYQKIEFSNEYNVGDKVYTIGYPNSSLKMEIHDGKILDDDITTIFDKASIGSTYLTFDAFISHGSSGGILLNNKGEIVGVTTRGRFDANDNFISGGAIESKCIQNAINDERVSKKIIDYVFLNYTEYYNTILLFKSLCDLGSYDAKKVTVNSNNTTIRGYQITLVDGSTSVSVSLFEDLSYKYEFYIAGDSSNIAEQMVASYWGKWPDDGGTNFECTYVFSGNIQLSIKANSIRMVSEGVTLISQKIYTNAEWDTWEYKKNLYGQGQDVTKIKNNCITMAKYTAYTMCTGIENVINNSATFFGGING